MKYKLVKPHMVKVTLFFVTSKTKIGTWWNGNSEDCFPLDESVCIPETANLSDFFAPLISNYVAKLEKEIKEKGFATVWNIYGDRKIYSIGGYAALYDNAAIPCAGMTVNEAMERMTVEQFIDQFGGLIQS